MTEGGADLAESCAWLVGLVNTHRGDIVHVNAYADDGLDVAPPVLVVAHCDVLPWWEAVRTQTAPPEWDDYRGRVVAGLFAATRVIAPTAAALQDLERRYVSLIGKAEVIANGVNFGAFPACPSAQ